MHWLLLPLQTKPAFQVGGEGPETCRITARAGGWTGAVPELPVPPAGNQDRLPFRPFRALGARAVLTPGSKPRRRGALWGGRGLGGRSVAPSRRLRYSS